jgi:hypothetical protein
MFNLADRKIYIGSEGSFYNILKEWKIINHRQNFKPSGLVRFGVEISLTGVRRNAAGFTFPI